MSRAGTVEGRERLRLFCALTLADDVVSRLSDWQAGDLAGGGRLVAPAHLHLTLAFLGGRPAGELAAIADALRAAAAAAAGPIVLEPVRYRETRSVGMLVLADEEGRAERFAEDLFDRLEALGVYARERREWLPHVTMVRFRRPPRLRPSLPPVGTFGPSDAAVYHSVLRPTGAQYVVLHAVPLDTGG